MDFTAFLNSQANAGAQSPVLPAGSANRQEGFLLCATDHMVVTAKLTPEHITKQLKAFYMLTAEQLGRALPAGSAARTRDGNVNVVGPLLVLANVNGRLHLLYGFSYNAEGAPATGRSIF